MLFPHNRDPMLRKILDYIEIGPSLIGQNDKYSHTSYGDNLRMFRDTHPKDDADLNGASDVYVTS